MSAKRHKPDASREARAVSWVEAPLCPVSGKRMYADESEANSTAAHRMSEERGPAQLSTYKCEYCGAWHLTSKKPR
jgi:hypothetical protein